LFGGVKGRPFHIGHIGELGAVTHVGEPCALDTLGTLKLGELGAVTHVGDARLGAAGEIASSASIFSVPTHESSSLDSPLACMFCSEKRKPQTLNPKVIFTVLF
jgi:hypothetical protein